jgi:hypothetical protein
MAKVDEIAEIAADGVADGMHIVSEEALAAEKAVRGLQGVQVAYIGLGVAIGAAIGSLVSFHLAYRKAETKFSEIAAEEISEMREHYNSKIIAIDTSTGKGELDEIVRERGYSVESAKPPMAVTPPTAVVEAAETARDIAEIEDEVAGEPPDVVEEAPEPEVQVRNVFRDAVVHDTWDYHEERSRRSPLKPYIIHVDERDDQQAYDSVTFTYYEADDVLCNERDEVIAEGERDKMIGETHLEKFGHGSNDASIVYVRNDSLEMDFEIVRSPNSYAEEVHGFEPEIRHSIRRRSFDDEQ